MDTIKARLNNIISTKNQGSTVNVASLWIVANSKLFSLVVRFIILSLM